MMPGVQFNDILNAIVSGFDDSELQMMLRLRLDTDLGAIVGPGPLRKRAFDLMSGTGGTETGHPVCVRI